MSFGIVLIVIIKLCQIILGKEFANVIQQFDDIVFTIKKARQDDTITSQERADILKEIKEFANSLADLVKSIGK